VSTPEGIARVYDCTEEELGPVEVVVHSVVIPLLGKVSDIPVEYLDRSYEVGPRAFFLLCRAASERMSPGGRIIQINSIGTPRYSPGYGAIGPAKAAMNQLMVHFAVELAPKGIRVNGVAASTVESKYIDGHPDADRLRAAVTRKTPVGRMGTEEDIARAVGLLCSSDAEFIVGQTIVADGGLTHKV
jgi:NAD(P)-dependent dehydrogenase (short-subunit alcohol dehydrogenase family)